jgi:Serpin (serine protease inhibitor)
VTTATAADLAAPLAAYARRFHAAVGYDHHAASPLGAWLLLALCGPACTGATRSELAQVLGCEIETAAATAAALLAQPHPLVAAAAGVWHREGAITDALAGWQAGLPPAVQTGPLRDQAQLNSWATEHSLGMIREFPIKLTPDTVLMLATALATRVSWLRPFDLAPASALGPGSPWATGVRQVLRTPARRDSGHRQFIAATELAGDVAVHTARAAGGLLVTSVAAAPDVPAGEVLAVANDLATAIASGRQPPRRSLFDLELGDGPLWLLTERAATVTAADGREERCTAVLPAWSADSSHDLKRPGLGFDKAAAALAELLGMPDYRYQARQACVARYSRTGFEAAAVTALAVAAMAMRPRPSGVLRTAELRFGHPFAVVAVAADENHDPKRSTGASPWHGMPVFSAWVARPEEAAEDLPSQ